VKSQKKRRKIQVKTKNKVKEKQKKVKPTKKALMLVEKYNIDIEKLGLEGIIKEKDLIPFIHEEDQTKKVDRCLILNRQDEFIKYLLDDELFRNLSSKEKIEKYNTNGHKIGENVIIHKGAVLIGNIIEIENDVSIGSGTYIESPEIYIGANTTIGNDCEFVASRIQVGGYNNISNKVYIDISGGRFPDSNFKMGRGCLIGYETYINVCRQVEIGENVALSPKSMIYTHSYWQSVLNGYPVTFGPVSIEDNAWLGSVAQILPNITVGTGSIIISNSLVTGNVKPYTMVGGVPAKIIKEDLKKNISEIKKEKIIKELFSELGDWLYSQHCVIEKINDRIFVINSDNEKKSCFLFENKIDLSKENGTTDIVISYNLNETTPKSYKTLFDINNKTVIGLIESVETMIIDFFRRRGIRFYEG